MDDALSDTEDVIASENVVESEIVVLFDFIASVSDGDSDMESEAVTDTVTEIDCFRVAMDTELLLLNESVWLIEGVMSVWLPVAVDVNDEADDNDIDLPQTLALRDTESELIIECVAVCEMRGEVDFETVMVDELDFERKELAVTVFETVAVVMERVFDDDMSCDSDAETDADGDHV